jgi:hypothetical protein
MKLFWSWMVSEVSPHMLHHIILELDVCFLVLHLVKHMNVLLERRYPWDRLNQLTLKFPSLIE